MTGPGETVWLNLGHLTLIGHQPMAYVSFVHSLCALAKHDRLERPERRPRCGATVPVQPTMHNSNGRNPDQEWRIVGCLGTPW